MSLFDFKAIIGVLAHCIFHTYSFGLKFSSHFAHISITDFLYSSQNVLSVSSKIVLICLKFCQQILSKLVNQQLSGNRARSWLFHKARIPFGLQM